MNPYKFKHFYFNKYVLSLFSKHSYHLSYNYKYKALWFRVAKVCTRSINQHFKESTPENQYIYSSKVPYSTSMFADFYKFAFVREPVNRFVSAWRNKVIDLNYFNFSQSERDEMRNLDSFITWAETLDIDNCDEHLQSQVTLIDVKNLDFVGRFENFAEDFAHVANAIGMPLEKIHQRNKSTPKENQLTSDQEKRIKALYARDYQEFYPNI